VQARLEDEPSAGLAHLAHPDETSSFCLWVARWMTSRHWASSSRRPATWMPSASLGRAHRTIASTFEKRRITLTGSSSQEACQELSFGARFKVQATRRYCMSKEVLFKLAVVASIVSVTLTAAVGQQSGSDHSRNWCPTTPEARHLLR